jgi:hypothetical protein
MILTKYRMVLPNGYIETLDIQEAIAFGNYVVINEEVDDAIEIA